MYAITYILVRCKQITQNNVHIVNEYICGNVFESIDLSFGLDIHQTICSLSDTMLGSEYCPLEIER